MICIQQLKLPLSHTEQDLYSKAAKTLKLPETQIKKCNIVKRSIDARKKSRVCYVYTLDVELQPEQGKKQGGSQSVSHGQQAAAKEPDFEQRKQDFERRIAKKVDSNNVMLTEREDYHFPEPGTTPLKHPPVVVGSGPAGLFCAYSLAKMGYAPLVLERGKRVEERQRDVALFWRENRLQPESNVQFGEGGAGAFSDGKLNTLVKDIQGRSRMVLDTFLRFGASKEIAYDSKPHIGTDILTEVIRNMREEIIRLGGTFLFETRLVDLEWTGNALSGVVCQRRGSGKPRAEGGDISETISAAGLQDGRGKPFFIETELVVLAIGHSARDTFEMLLRQQLHMEAKAFAVGLRVEHPQSMISETQYGREAMGLLPAAPYKVTANLSNGRGVYSFCMCPGGYVVNASSEPGRLAVNGMSYSRRDGANANSAIIVSVTPADFPEEGPLSGVAFQRQLEEKAYRLGAGSIPQQLFGDFELGRISTGYGGFESCVKGAAALAPLHDLFPREIKDSFVEGVHRFSGAVRGFDRQDCILSGVESRTSSPVRISRNDNFESNRKGVYPCGEGAGYAGGIMSAAMDGLKVAEAIISKYRPL